MLIFRDNKYKYTFWYFFKPFFVSLLCTLIWFFVWRLWKFYAIFIDFDMVYFFVFVIFILLLFFTVRFTIFFGKVFYYRKAVEKHENNLMDGRVMIYEGAPGSGKSVSMTYDMYIIAKKCFDDLTYQYFYTDYGVRKNYIDFKNKEVLQAYQSIKDSYTLYANNNAIPLLFANYAIMEKSTGNYCYRADFDMFLQKIRLPENAVIAYDESAEDLSNQRSKVTVHDLKLKKENEIVNDFLSKERHYFNGYLGFAEQDSEENFIGLRRVVYKNLYLTGLSKVCLPMFLLGRFENCRKKIIKRKKCTDKLFKKITVLQKKIVRIGFLKINYEVRGNMQKSRAVLESGWYALPCNMPFVYSDRFYRFDYGAIALPLACDVYERLLK